MSESYDSQLWTAYIFKYLALRMLHRRNRYRFRWEFVYHVLVYWGTLPWVEREISWRISLNEVSLWSLLYVIYLIFFLFRVLKLFKRLVFKNSLFEGINQIHLSYGCLFLFWLFSINLLTTFILDYFLLLK